MPRKSKVEEEARKILKLLKKSRKVLSPELEKWIKSSPKLYMKKRKLGMAIKSPIILSPIKQRIRDLIAGKRVRDLETRKLETLAAQATAKGLAGTIKKALRSAIKKPKQVLESVALKLVEAVSGGQVFDVPVSQLKRKLDKRALRVTPEQSQNMIALSSPNVFSAGFEPSNENAQVGTLYIQFRNGWVYKYKDAAIWLYKGLLASNSPGRFVWANIRRGLYRDGEPYGSLSGDGYTKIR